MEVANIGATKLAMITRVFSDEQSRDCIKAHLVLGDGYMGQSAQGHCKQDDSGRRTRDRSLMES